MAVKLYEPTQEEDLTLTKPAYYQINKDKISNENNIYLESKFVFESKGNLQETSAFITKDGYVVVEDWDLLMNAFDEALFGDKVYISVDNHEIPVFLGIDMIEETSCILAYSPNVEYEPHIKEMVQKLEQEGNMNFEEYNIFNSKKDNQPKMK